MTVMVQPVIWHGMQQQFEQLRRAVDRNCTCDKATIINPNPPKCPTHKMLTDQEALNHLAAVKFAADRFQESEWRGRTHG